MLGMLRPRIRRAFRLAVRRDDWTEADVDEEIRLHVELRVEQLVASGWRQADAELEARRRFGPSWDDAVRHLHDSGRAREERLAMRERLGSIWQDVRYSARGLRRSPRFAATAVATLALGLGFTTAILSLVDHIVLRPLPYADADRLVVVREIPSDLAALYPTMPANASHFLEWRRACSACASLSAMRKASYTVSGAGDPDRLAAMRVSANLFSLLAVRPALGRAFEAEMEQAGNDRVVVISDALWRRRFGADPAIVGRTIALGDTSMQIIGVLPRDFALPLVDALGPRSGIGAGIDVYRPLALSKRERETAGEFDYTVLARLRSGATPEQVRAQLDPVEADFAARDGRGRTLKSAVIPLHEQMLGGAERPLLLLLAAVGAVLLIVCVNLANLLLARHAARQHESAIRIALGAGRSRLARLALAESVVIALAGGTLGLLLARWGLSLLIALAPATLPRVGEVRLDARVLTLGAVLTLAVALLVGLLPALRAGRAAPNEALKAGGRTATDGRASGRRRAAFITAQVAFSTVLLVGAGLFLRSFAQVMRVERGFDTERVLALDVVLPNAAYPTDTGRMQAYDRLMAEVTGVPGVVSSAAASALPLEGESWVNGLVPEGEAGVGRERQTANYRFVSPTYFATMNTPIRRGRTFSDADRKQRVIIISERAARVLWPGENPVGKRIMPWGDDKWEVIGTAADVRTSSLEKEGSLVAYLPIWAFPPVQGALVVRTAGDAGVVTSAVRAAIRRVEPSAIVPNVRTMEQVVESSVAARRFQLGLLAVFAVMALVTASVGIYGVMAQSLASRTREIGVRMALGARPWDVHRLVLREGLAPVALGLVLGVAGSLALGRLIQNLLFEVRSGDPRTILGVGLLLGAVAVVACVIPARRATMDEVSDMLRME
jgi:predicted permease